MDGGTDINHEDLKDVLWTNTKEIPGNGIDDDKNGYIDDVHGWNFIGGKNGNVAYDNLELVRIKRKLDPQYRGFILSTKMDSSQKEEFKLWTKVTAEFGKKYDEALSTFSALVRINRLLDTAATAVKKTVPSLEDVEAYKADNEEEEYWKGYIRKESKNNKSFEGFVKEMKKALRDYEVMVKYNLNDKYDKRAEIVGDNYADANERFYGNNDVVGPHADHGSHVAGIIAGNRNNTIGINGVANNVSIMVVRVVPEGDERDKDVANGIRYAVDNGAKVINMSFGKSFKWNKQVVDEAVKYAEEKGVLIVHAAGNDNLDNDRNDNFPNKYYDSEEARAYDKANKKPEQRPFTPVDPRMQSMERNSGFNQVNRVKPVIDSAKFNLPHASNWIEVGASAYKDNDELKASFSNYGKNNVDVFAPGFMINSTVPGSKYDEFDGTSMAAPVVSGLASLILSYYPQFTPAQVRDIIIKSSVKVGRKIKYTNARDESLRTTLSELSVSGGIANAYNALKTVARDGKV
ncbi:MAG: peptidase S8 [Pedobacter sp.]|nr:MAG: peptidase S8 [Pedobacter sp.]